MLCLPPPLVECVHPVCSSLSDGESRVEAVEARFLVEGEAG